MGYRMLHTTSTCLVFPATTTTGAGAKQLICPLLMSGLLPVSRYVPGGKVNENARVTVVVASQRAPETPVALTVPGIRRFRPGDGPPTSRSALTTVPVVSEFCISLNHFVDATAEKMPLVTSPQNRLRVTSCESLAKVSGSDGGKGAMQPGFPPGRRFVSASNCAAAGWDSVNVAIRPAGSYSHRRTLTAAIGTGLFASCWTLALSFVNDAVAGIDGHGPRVRTVWLPPPLEQPTTSSVNAATNAHTERRFASIVFILTLGERGRVLWLRRFAGAAAASVTRPRGSTQAKAWRECPRVRRSLRLRIRRRRVEWRPAGSGWRTSSRWAGNQCLSGPKALLAPPSSARPGSLRLLHERGDVRFRVEVFTVVGRQPEFQRHVQTLVASIGTNSLSSPATPAFNFASDMSGSVFGHGMTGLACDEECTRIGVCLAVDSRLKRSPAGDLSSWSRRRRAQRDSGTARTSGDEKDHD